MQMAIAGVGAVICVLGVAGLAAPTRISKGLDGFKSSPIKIYGWAAVRVLMGVVLILGASDTAFPTLIRFIGAVLVLKAGLVPLMGLDRARSILEWLQARPPHLIRLLFLPVAAFGAFLVWAALQP
ncbi:MAG: hypothetical protein OER77_17220 [Myxococcales bacterium]|nr:hypothetical protein [Myxococcales bacterium]